MSWSNNCICFICHLNFPTVSVHSEESNIAVHFVRLPLCSVYYLKLKHNYIISCFPHNPLHAQHFACSFSPSLSFSLLLSLPLSFSVLYILKYLNTTLSIGMLVTFSIGICDWRVDHLVSNTYLILVNMSVFLS